MKEIERDRESERESACSNESRSTILLIKKKRNRKFDALYRYESPPVQRERVRERVCVRRSAE